MSDQMHERLAAAAARLREQQEKLADVQAELAGLTTTVTSKNRMVSVTVGGDGRLTEFAVKGNGFRTMAPAELSSVLLETVNSALEQAATRANQVAGALLPPGLGPQSGADGKFDLAEMMSSVFKLGDGPLLPWEGEAPPGITRPSA